MINSQSIQDSSGPWPSLRILRYGAPRALAVLRLVGGAWLCLCLGCGATKQNTATEQLLMSNAVDATISKLDFSELAHRKVYLDSAFVNKPITTVSPVAQPLAIDSNYVLSSLRQQMFAAGVLLVENRDEAEIIAEPRIGALGIDGHDVTYGIPASNSIATASSAVAGTPLLPPIPEISFARKEDRMGAARIAVFAYYRDTREAFWQSGVAQSNSDSKATWILGAGPFQRGSIRSGTEFAGSRVLASPTTPELKPSDNLEKYLSNRIFEKSPSKEVVQQASHQQQPSPEPTSNPQSSSVPLPVLPTSQ
ncbi:MAG: hypothetical protein KF752_20890 [Pirellulaceae bacterium]|nr:hypothetical protein [Pirellulaceae bacterium]